MTNVEELLKDLFDLGVHIELGQYMLLCIEYDALCDLTSQYINEGDLVIRGTIAHMILGSLLELKRFGGLG